MAEIISEGATLTVLTPTGAMRWASINAYDAHLPLGTLVIEQGSGYFILEQAFVDNASGAIQWLPVPIA